jgi:hypothetical protein
MEADGRLIEHVEHAAQVAAELRGEADALALATAQRASRAVELQVTETHFLQEGQALSDLRQDIARDQAVAISADLEFFEMLRGMLDRQACQVRQRRTLEAHRASFRVEARAVASRTLHQFLVLHPLDLAIRIHLRLQHGLVARSIEMMAMLRHHAVAAALRAPAMRRIE